MTRIRPRCSRPPPSCAASFATATPRATRARRSPSTSASETRCARSPTPSRGSGARSRGTRSTTARPRATAAATPRGRPPATRSPPTARARSHGDDHSPTARRAAQPARGGGHQRAAAATGALPARAARRGRTSRAAGSRTPRAPGDRLARGPARLTQPRPEERHRRFRHLNARRTMHEPISVGAPGVDPARPSGDPGLARAAAGRDQHAHAILRRHGIAGVAPTRLTLRAVGRLIDAQATADRVAGLDWTRITTPARALDPALRRAHARLGVDLDDPAVWTRRDDQRAALTRRLGLSDEQTDDLSRWALEQPAAFDADDLGCWRIASSTWLRLAAPPAPAGGD